MKHILTIIFSLALIVGYSQKPEDINNLAACEGAEVVVGTDGKGHWAVLDTCYCSGENLVNQYASCSGATSLFAPQVIIGGCKDVDTQNTLTSTNGDLTINPSVNPDGSLNYDLDVNFPPDVNTTLVNNGDGTYTYTNEVGVTTVIDINEIDMDVNQVTIAGSVLTFTSEDGTTVLADVCALVAANCNSPMIVNPDGSVTYTDNAGTTTIIPAPVDTNTTYSITYVGDELTLVGSDGSNVPVTIVTENNYYQVTSVDYDPSTGELVLEQEDENGNPLPPLDTNIEFEERADSVYYGGIQYTKGDSLCTSTYTDYYVNGVFVKVDSVTTCCKVEESNTSVLANLNTNPTLNPIASHDDGTGNVVNISETVTSITQSITGSDVDDNTVAANQNTFVNENGTITTLCEGFDQVYITKICPDESDLNDQMIRGVNLVGKSLEIESAPEHYTLTAGSTLFNDAYNEDITGTGFINNNRWVTLTFNNPSDCRAMTGYRSWRFLFGVDIENGKHLRMLGFLRFNGGAPIQIVNKEARVWESTADEISRTEDFYLFQSVINNLAAGASQTHEYDIRLNRLTGAAGTWVKLGINANVFMSTTNN